MKVFPCLIVEMHACVIEGGALKSGMFSAECGGIGTTSHDSEQIGWKRDK